MSIRLRPLRHRSICNEWVFYVVVVVAVKKWSLPRHAELIVIRRRGVPNL